MNKVVGFDFKFTTGSAQKYKGKWGQLAFCILRFTMSRNVSFSFYS